MIVGSLAVLCLNIKRTIFVGRYYQLANSSCWWLV